jgi:purine nucleosidase
MNRFLIFSISLFLLMIVSSCKRAGIKTDISANTGDSVKSKVKMILDLDTGIDDAMALAYAVGSPDIALIGITGIYGNVSTETSIRNSLDLLSLLHIDEIPVYKGATHSYSDKDTYSPVEVSKFIHGNNGIGNVKIAESTKRVEKEDAVDFIIESAKKYGKELVIVATGPMTNLADAIKKEPELKEMVGNIVIMGGALTVPGNINELAEANIYQDPVAANYLFTSGAYFTMVGLDVTHRPNLTKSDTQKWRLLGTASGENYADIVDYYIDAYHDSAPQLNGCALHDPLAVAVAVHPELVETISMYMVVGTSREDWGRTIGDKTKLTAADPNVKVCVNVDYKAFIKDFNEVLTNLFRQN